MRSSECDTDGGFVLHEGKRLGFGEVADDAARLRPPDKPALRPIEGRKLAGETLPRLDLPAKSDGSFRFASDVRLPRMIFGSIRMAPPGGRLVGFSRENAMRQQGAIELVVRDQWLGALGQTWWAADRALTRAAPRFSGTDSGDISGHYARLMESGKSERLFERGDYAGTTEDSTPLAATYFVRSNAASLAGSTGGGSPLCGRSTGGLGRNANSGPGTSRGRQVRGRRRR